MRRASNLLSFRRVTKTDFRGFDFEHKKKTKEKVANGVLGSHCDLPSYFLAQLVVLFDVFAALHTHLTIGKLQLGICGRRRKKKSLIKLVNQCGENVERKCG